MAVQRDYYDDLELPRDAEINDIKKQFRKLALKYHPDRNPGREQEVNAKFQIIQAAHEVLSDPTEKAKYDTTLGRSAARGPGASGVRGNPWANAGAQFPTPPRRTTPAKNAQQSGAQRWQTRFSTGVPPTAKQTHGLDPEAKKNAAKAFENMRKHSQREPRSSEPPPPPPRQPPRTESARQRAEASFGSRKSGYYPRSTVPGDEPPVTRQNYSSTERRDVPPPPPFRPGQKPMPDPLSQFRDKKPSFDTHQEDQQQSSGFPGNPNPASSDRNTERPVQGDGQTHRADQEVPPYTANSSRPGAESGPAVNRASYQTKSASTTDPKTAINGDGPSIFSIPVDDDIFSHSGTTSGGHGFTKSSLDDINTNFVKDQDPNTWQFRACTEETDANAESGFNPQGWSDKFGPQTFVPQQAPAPSASPTRASSRGNSKRSRTKATGATAVAVEEVSSDEDSYEWRGRNANAPPGPTATDGPQAMDIDSSCQPSAAEEAQAQSVRNIPVEPSRPEWRAGNLDGMSQGTAAPRPADIPLYSNAAGSEDSDEFRTTFAELKNVAPFSQQGEGLASLGGLKDNLPFDSKASDVPPVTLPRTQPLAFPAAPVAPRPPPALAVEGMTPTAASWAKYLTEFGHYLTLWDSFNGQVVDHFATRKSLIADMRASKGYGFLGTRGGGELQEYYNWVQQDNDVHGRWMKECEEHQGRLQEFLAFRDRKSVV